MHTIRFTPSTTLAMEEVNSELRFVISSNKSLIKFNLIGEKLTVTKDLIGLTEEEIKILVKSIRNLTIDEIKKLNGGIENEKKN